MSENVVSVGVPLVNEYGSSYGTLWLLFARRPVEINEWVQENLNYPDGKPYYQDRDVWDQCHVEGFTVFDKDGNLTRDHWWTLLEWCAHRKIGPSVLEKISRLREDVQ